MSKGVLYSKEDAITRIIFDRPEAQNALNYAMAEELEEAINQIEADREVRIATLIGQGEKSFMAGSDIKELREGIPCQVGLILKKRQKILKRFDNMGKPTIAAVNGYAYGTCCEVAPSCSLRIASERAKFVQQEINLGIMPGAGETQRLPRLIEKGRALELC